MCDRTTLRELIGEIVKAYQIVFGKQIVQIRLYGSYARGDADGESDIDLVAIVHGDRRDLQQKLKRVWDVSSDLELEYGVIISPTVIPYDEYMKYKEDIPYYRNISREGVDVVA